MNSRVKFTTNFNHQITDYTYRLLAMHSLFENIILNQFGFEMGGIENPNQIIIKNPQTRCVIRIFFIMHFGGSFIDSQHLHCIEYISPLIQYVHNYRNWN